MTIPFRELPGSPIETFDADGVRAQRRLVCPWDGRHRLADELLGNGEALGGIGAAGYPGIENLVAVRVRLEPVSEETLGPILDDVAGGLGVHSRFALVSADYDLLDSTSDAPAEPGAPSVPPRTFIAGGIEPDVEMLPVLPAGLRWQSAPGQPVPDALALGLRVPVLVHVRTWRRVSEPPLAAIRACLGKVNVSEFLGAAPETLLFDGCRMEREWVTASEGEHPQSTWRLAYRFRERRLAAASLLVGWNHAYRPEPAETAGWDRLLDAAGSPLYASADFAALFQFG